MMRERAVTDVSPQVSNALARGRTAASTSPAVARRTCDCGAPTRRVVDVGEAVALAGDARAADPVVVRRSCVVLARCRVGGARWCALVGSCARRTRAGLLGATRARRPRRPGRPTMPGCRAPGPAGRSRRGSRSCGSDCLGLEHAPCGSRRCRVAASTSAPRLAALAARSTGSRSPSRPVLGAVAVLRAEPLRAERLRERADRGEAVVLHQHDDDLDALGDRGDELGVHHQVGAVADHDEHVAFVAARRARPA